VDVVVVVDPYCVVHRSRLEDFAEDLKAQLGGEATKWRVVHLGSVLGMS
jgi:hypothetical protein